MATVTSCKNDLYPDLCRDRGAGGAGGAHAPSIILPELKFKEKKFRKDSLVLFLVLFSPFRTFILRKTALFCFAADPCNSVT